MSDDHQRQSEKVEAARQRDEYATRVDPAEIHRLRMNVEPGELEQRSLYGTGMSVTTTPGGILDRWQRNPAANTDNTGQQQGSSESTNGESASGDGASGDR